MISHSRNATRLRASPNFVQALTLDGRAYIAKETEPYHQFWLNERYRILLALFSVRRGLTPQQAIARYYRLTQVEPSAAENRRLVKAIADMQASEVLISSHADTSRYDESMANYYLTYRPFPSALTAHMVKAAGIESHTRILDLAGGPGDLAVQLAQVSDAVELMELSQGFLAAARARADALGVKLETIHESCNRLHYHDAHYDVLTIAQAIHWLDDVLLCRGICRLLAPNGSFFVIQSIIEVDDKHPLAYLLGHNSILGAKTPQPFIEDVRPLWRRLGLLFDALDSPGVEHVDVRYAAESLSQKIVPVDIKLFTQVRPFDQGFAQGFLTPKHIQATGLEPNAFWQDLAARCADATPAQLLGTHHWAVMQFQRGGVAMDFLEIAKRQAQSIEFTLGTA